MKNLILNLIILLIFSSSSFGMETEGEWTESKSSDFDFMKSEEYKKKFYKKQLGGKRFHRGKEIVQSKFSQYETSDCIANSKVFFGDKRYYFFFDETKNLTDKKQIKSFVSKNCFENAYFFENLINHVHKAEEVEALKKKIEQTDFNKKPYAKCIRDGATYYSHPMIKDLPEVKDSIGTISKTEFENLLKINCLEDPTMYTRELKQLK